MRRKPLADRPQLREVTEQRAAVAAPEGERAAVVLEDPAEAVPLGLVPPPVARWELVDELRLHRRERDVGTRRVHAMLLCQEGHAATLSSCAAKHATQAWNTRRMMSRLSARRASRFVLPSAVRRARYACAGGYIRAWVSTI